MRTQKFNEVQQLPTSSGQKGREILLIDQLHDTIHGAILLYSQRIPEEKETNKSKFRSEMKLVSSWETARTRVSIDRAVDHCLMLSLLPLGGRLSGRSQLPCARSVHGRSTIRSTCPLSSAKNWDFTNTIEKSSTNKIYALSPHNSHISEDFSNLSQTQHNTMSTSSGCTNVVAYVLPTQEIKPSVVHPNELHRVQATRDME